MTKCVECDRPADFSTTSLGAKRVLSYCVPCAKQLAKIKGWPALGAAAADAEKRKATPS